MLDATKEGKLSNITSSEYPSVTEAICYMDRIDV